MWKSVGNKVKYFLFTFSLFILYLIKYLRWKKVNEKILISNKYKFKRVSHLLGLKLELELLSNLVLTSLVFVKFLDDFILLS